MNDVEDGLKDEWNGMEINTWATLEAINYNCLFLDQNDHSLVLNWGMTTHTNNGINKYHLLWCFGLVERWNKVKTLMLRLNKECGHDCEPMTKWNGHDDAWYDVMYANEIEQKVGKWRLNFGVWQYSYHLGSLFVIFINIFLLCFEKICIFRVI